jgi:hypothetical protein
MTLKDLIRQGGHHLRIQPSRQITMSILTSFNPIHAHQENEVGRRKIVLFWRNAVRRKRENHEH